MSELYNNSLVLKIHGGTQRSDENLCATCRNCTRRVGAHSGREEVTCEANYQRSLRLSEPVVQCNRYSDRRRPTLEMMHEIAWELMTNKGGRLIGFCSPQEARERRYGPQKPSVGF